MRILVTGGAGFIGSHLALALAEEKHLVHVVDNFDGYYEPSLKRQNARLLMKKKILIHELDLGVDPLEGMLEDVEFVIHAAAQPGNDANTPYFSYIKNNFHATVALLESLKNKKVPMIFCSTSSVYGLNATEDETTLPAPVSPYGVTKVAAEAAVQAAVRRGEIDACILRYFSVFGPSERPDKLFPKLFYALMHGTEFPLYEGSEKHLRSFTYVSDIVDGTLKAMKNWEKVRGEIFNIGTDEQVTTAHAIEVAEQITGKKLKIKKLPPRAGDQLATHANIDKARRTFGYAPQTKLREGLKHVYEALKTV